MEASDSEILAQVKVNEMETVTEPLSTEPILIANYLGERKDVQFGNSGLVLRFEPGENKFDFTPENANFRQDDKERKYAEILCASLLETHKLLNDSSKMAEMKLEGRDLSGFSGFTNSVMIGALERLAAKSEHPDFMAVDEKRRIVNIDLQKFKDLPDGDPLIIYLKRVSGRVKNETVTYEKEVEAKP